MRKPENINVEESEKLVKSGANVDRRTALKLAAVFGASLLEACRGCNKDIEKDDGVDYSVPSMVPEEKLEVSKPERMFSPELPRDENVKLPNFEFKSQTWPLDKPIEYPGTVEEFKNDSKEIADALKNALITYTLPVLRQNPGEKTAVILQALSGIANSMGRHNERMRITMNRLHAKLADNGRPEPVVEEINKHLHVAGLHLAIFVGMGGEATMELFEIKDMGYATTKMDGKFYKLPALTMGKDHLDGVANSGKTGTLASCNPTFDYMMIYSGKFERNLNELQYVFKFSDAERQDMIDSFLQHEATHLYLAERFPTAGKMVDEGKGYKVNISFLADVAKIDMDIRIMPAGFHELAGFGMQIAKGKKSSRHQLKVYLQNKMQGTYALVSQFLPLALVGVAKNSSLKKSIADKFFDKNTKSFGAVSGDELIALVDEMSDEECAKVGETLYQMAYHFMRRMDEGEFEKINL